MGPPTAFEQWSVILVFIVVKTLERFKELVVKGSELVDFVEDFVNFYRPYGAFRKQRLSTSLSKSCSEKNISHDN